MPRISGQRSVGSTGVKMLQRSVEHARRMVVSRLPANLPPASAETSAPTPSYGNQPELLAPGAQFSDAAPVQRAPQPQASAPVHGTGDLRNSPTMPRDLQSIFNRHKAMGHVREQAGGIQAMIDSQKSQAQRSREEASKPRLQPRPENVHTEP